MPSATSLPRRCAVLAALFLAGSALFSAAYCQAPLYYSNQNQYFLHGLARAGYGLLDEDWLANTADPTPAFSALVAVTARYVHEWAFHAYYALLLGAYAASMLGLFVHLVGAETAARRWPVFLALFVLVHSALLRWLSQRLVGFDYPWFLQAGVAGQYLLGAMLQPSAFGALLVVAVCLFAHGRPLLAAAFIGLAADLHSTYLLSGAFLTLGFTAGLLWERRVWAAVGVGAIALALVLPIVVFILIRFGPTSPEAFAQAQDLLVNFRIPHHSRPDLWLDPVAGLQIAWVMASIALVRGTRLFPVLAVPFVLAALLTLAQVATGSNTLALLFPWRVSAVLVPVATTVILSRLVALPGLPVGGAAVRVASLVIVAGLAVAGAWISVNRLGFRSNDDEVGMLEFVRQNRASGDVYLIPVRLFPQPKRWSGSKSSDFQPAAQKKRDDKIIPVDLQRFRLYTGAPIYVDFKSIPYKDADVIEWRHRLQEAETFQEKIAKGRLTHPADELRRLGVTHLVAPATERVSGGGLEMIYEDPSYRVYRLRP